MLQFITKPSSQYSMPEEARMALEGGCRWIELSSEGLDQEENVLKDIAKEMAKLRHNDCIAYVTQSFGDRQNILWRSLDDLMAVDTQSFDDRQKIYGIEFSVFN